MTRNLDLLRALVADNQESVHRLLADPAAEPAAFLAFAHRHQLGAFVYTAVRRAGADTLLPPALRRAAKAAWLLDRAPSERAVCELPELAALLERGGVGALFLKGPLLAKRYYGTLEARAVQDLDILVRSDDLARVEALLLDGGYHRQFRVPVSRRLARAFAHHFEYRRGAVPLDVHWALHRHFSVALEYERIWATATAVDLDGRSYPATSDEYEILLQILGVMTDLQVGKLTARPLVDLVHMLAAVESTIKWDVFMAARRREHVLRPTAFVLALVLDVLDCHDRFATLHACLSPMRETLPPTSLGRDALLGSRSLDVGQKLLALRIYEASLAASIGWWMLSLPVRLVVYGTQRLTGP
jgi:hypothetical protein